MFIPMSSWLRHYWGSKSSKIREAEWWPIVACPWFVSRGKNAVYVISTLLGRVFTICVAFMRLSCYFKLVAAQKRSKRHSAGRLGFEAGSPLKSPNASISYKNENNNGTRTSLAFQWLRLLAFTAVGLGSIPGRGTKILKDTWPGQKLKKKKWYSPQRVVVRISWHYKGASVRQGVLRTSIVLSTQLLWDRERHSLMSGSINREDTQTWIRRVLKKPWGSREYEEPKGREARMWAVYHTQIGSIVTFISLRGKKVTQCINFLLLNNRWPQTQKLKTYKFIIPQFLWIRSSGTT